MLEKALGGYNRKILRVNLSNERISEEATDELFCRRYLGGAGFVAYYLWKELPADIDPLSSDNKLVFAVGPVTGVSLGGSGRHCVGAKSPLTGGIAKSEVGEFWGVELKRAGYDAVIIEGKSEKPVYLWIHNGMAEIRDCTQLWGRGTKETQDAIRQELADDKIRLALIGSAGENMVRFSCIMHGLFDVAGRGGLGAVMGAKNLKAVAVRGHTAPEVADREGLKQYRQWLAGNLESTSNLRNYGTGAGMAAYEASGNLPVRNFRDGLFPGVNKIDAIAIKDTIQVGMDGCFACPVRCKKAVKFDKPYQVNPAYGGPEYETLAALGSNCGIDDLAAVCLANQLCGDYALDTISTGSTIAFAMECFENGLITTRDTGGIELRFGNAEAMLKTIDLIAHRKGIGALLAEGSLRAARQIGQGAEDFVVHVKGLEPGMHEPRIMPGFGLGFMVNPHGADHQCNMMDTEYTDPNCLDELRTLGILELLPADEISPRKVALFKAMQLKAIINDSLVICQFLPYSFTQLAGITAAVCGWDTDIAEQMRVAERILTVMRLFNIRNGFTEKEDVLPRRFYQPKTDGVLSDTALDPIEQEKAKHYYYTLMGWDANTGIPLPERVEELEIK